MKNCVKKGDIKPNACVKTVGGKPTLFIDGKITTPLIYSLASHIKPMRAATALSQRNLKYFAESGIDLVEVETILSDCWRKNGDFSEMPIYAEVAEVVRANPKAKVILRLHLQPPYWWLRDNQDELCKLAEYEMKDNGEPYMIISETCELTYHESFASEKWISDTSEKLALLCERLKNSDMAGHIAGIHVGSGVYSEWHYYGFGGHPDYSPCMQRRFKEFLKEKYRSAEDLQKAWGNPDVTFETAELPYFGRRFPENDSYFRDPIKDRDVADSLECLQDTVADAVIAFCKVVKESWSGILTGAFYGYFFGVFGILATTGGHLAMRKIYENEKYIDFLCAPLCYYTNRRVDGTFFPRGVLESERLNNILWLTEMDSAPYEIGIWQRGTTIKDNSPDVKEKSSFALKRNILGNLTRGMGAWFFDHRTYDEPVKTDYLKDAGWWEDERYRKDIKRLREIYDRFYPMDYKDETDVLLVYDTDVYYEMARAVFSEETIEPRMNAAISKTGVNFREIYLDDLEKVDKTQYKCVVFVNMFLLKGEKRALVEKFVRESSADIVWMFAPGYSDGRRLSEDLMYSLTGFKLKKTSGVEEIKYTVGDDTETLATEEKLRECFYIDGECEPFAYYKDGSVSAGKINKSGKNIWYLPYYILPEKLWERIFTDAGAHRYSEDDGVYILCGNRVLAAFCKDGGKKTIFLKNGKSVTLDLPKYSVAVMDSETGEIIDI